MQAAGEGLRGQGRWFLFSLGVQRSGRKGGGGDFEPWKGRSRRVYGSAWRLGLDVAGGEKKK